MDKLLEELECPICTDYLTIPIRQCSTGHSICEKCIEKLDSCALCRSNFTDSRNITLEQLALKMKYPCPNKNLGCNESLSYPEREKHELRCKFKGFQTACPLRGCNFIGDSISMKSHWLAKKSTSKIFQTVNSSSTKLKNDSYYVNLVEGFGELFWYKTKSFNNNMYFAMQFLGKPAQSGNYYFEIEFNKTGTRKKIILSDNCKSIELTDKDLFNEDSCSIIGFGALSQYLVNDFLNYHLRLYNDKNAGGREHKQRSTSRTNMKPPCGQQDQNKGKDGAKPKQRNFNPKKEHSK